MVDKIIKLDENKETTPVPKNYPSFKGDGVAVWVNEDQNGKQYLSVKFLNSITVNCFQYVPKEK